MKTRTWIALVVVILALGITTLVVFLTTQSFQTTLEFTVRDAVSKEWVYDSAIRFQNRIIRGYFGKDYSFTRLKPGETTLSISAPSYIEKEIPVKIKRGKNVLEEPIDVAGYEIPTLSHFIVIEDVEDGELVTEVRPVGQDGKAVVNHPCLDLRILLLISAQMYKGKLARTDTETGSARGEELYRGAVDWRWDSDPNTIFRYRVPIPVKKVKQSDASFWVIDYLILVPDSRNVTAEEMDKFVQEIGGISDPEQLTAKLDTYEGKLKYYLNESWNVEGGQL
jgi:hypothetical protein